ncbi:hypothetical protein C8R46DRAFT_1040602 [Mycena filopes]|nr:hypothetical protein C8R46DRAFT_1040602 [Mycena filopes]
MIILTKYSCNTAPPAESGNLITLKTAPSSPDPAQSSTYCGYKLSRIFYYNLPWLHIRHLPNPFASGTYPVWFSVRSLGKIPVKPSKYLLNGEPPSVIFGVGYGLKGWFTFLAMQKQSTRSREKQSRNARRNCNTISGTHLVHTVEALASEFREKLHYASSQPARLRSASCLCPAELPPDRAYLEAESISGGFPQFKLSSHGSKCQSQCRGKMCTSVQKSSMNSKPHLPLLRAHPKNISQLLEQVASGFIIIRTSWLCCHQFGTSVTGLPLSLVRDNHPEQTQRALAEPQNPVSIKRPPSVRYTPHAGCQYAAPDVPRKRLTGWPSLEPDAHSTDRKAI